MLCAFTINIYWQNDDFFAAFKLSTDLLSFLTDLVTERAAIAAIDWCW